MESTNQVNSAFHPSGISKWVVVDQCCVRLFGLTSKSVGAGLAYGLWAVRPLCLWHKAPLQLPLVAQYNCYMPLPNKFNIWVCTLQVAIGTLHRCFTGGQSNKETADFYRPTILMELCPPPLPQIQIRWTMARQQLFGAYSAACAVCQSTKNCSRHMQSTRLGAGGRDRPCFESLKASASAMHRRWAAAVIALQIVPARLRCAIAHARAGHSSSYWHIHRCSSTCTFF